MVHNGPRSLRFAVTRALLDAAAQKSGVDMSKGKALVDKMEARNEQITARMRELGRKAR